MNTLKFLSNYAVKKGSNTTHTPSHTNQEPTLTIMKKPNGGGVGGRWARLDLDFLFCSIGLSILVHNTQRLNYSLLLSCLSLVQLCVTPTDGSPPGSPVPGILQARTLAWVAISFSNAWKWKVKVKSLSRVGLFANPWTAAYQAPLSMGLSRQEYWSGVPLPSPITLYTYKNK